VYVQKQAQLDWYLHLVLRLQ